jgi:hypothetical protein
MDSIRDSTDEAIAESLSAVASTRASIDQLDRLIAFSKVLLKHSRLLLERA